jgi:hypothetical protein
MYLQSAAMTEPPAKDYDRTLGVIEAITAVTRQCPSGAVRACAERALTEIQTGGPDALRRQAYNVMVAVQGWRGDRARQVYGSLESFLAEQEPNTDDE